MKWQKTVEWIFLGALLVLSFAVKLIELDNPFYGDNSIRQLQTLSTIDYYTQNGIDLLKPRINYAGWPGILVLELPIFQAMAALLSGFTENSLITTRILNLGFALLSLVIVFKIAELLFDREIAKYSMLFFAFAPLNLKYHPSVLIDVSNVTYALLANWFLLKYLQEKKNRGALALFTFFGSLCVAMKAIYFFPIATILIHHYGTQVNRPVMLNLAFYLRRNAEIFLAVLVIACVMTTWLVTTENLHHILDHGLATTESWKLLKLEFYIKSFYRLSEVVLNPLTLFLFILGCCWLWKNRHNRDGIVLVYTVVFYYLIFSNITLAHEYYSLSMVPYFSMIAACGFRWVVDQAISTQLLKSRSALKLLIYGVSAAASVLIFISNNLIGVANKEITPVKLSKEVSPKLVPGKYSIVYVNKPAVPLADFFPHRRTLYLLHYLKILSDDQVRARVSRPIVPPVILYALRQFGEVTYVTKPLRVDVDHLQEKYQGNLRYILFYLFGDQYGIPSGLKEYQQIYRSHEWTVFDLLEKNKIIG